MATASHGYHCIKQDNMHEVLRTEPGIQVALNKKCVLLLKVSEERQRWHLEQTVLRLQLGTLPAERNTAEQGLVALFDLHM